MNSDPTPSDQRRSRWNAWVLMAAIMALWGAVAITVMARDPVIHNTDMFGFIQRAESLSLHNAAGWVNGFYPVGYPLLLRAIFCLVKDYDLAGRIISVLSGLTGLVLVCRIGCVIFDRRIGILALAFCATNPDYLTLATTSGTDMLAATMMMFGLLAACFYSTHEDRRWLAASGLLFGLGYLVRYTTLVMMSAVVVWLLVRPKNESIFKERLAEAIILALAFVLAAAPQLILSAMIRGNPFYNQQASNVYYGIFGHPNWSTWSAALKVTSLSEILLVHPREFARNWLSNIKLFFGQDLAQFPLNLFVFPAMFFCLKKGVNIRLTLLLFLAFLVYGFGLAIAFIDYRQLLPCAPIALIFAAYGFYEFVPDLPVRGKWLRHARQAGFVLLLFWMFEEHERPLLSINEWDRVRMEVSHLLNRSGMKSSREVLSFSLGFYNLASPTKENFAAHTPPAAFTPDEFVPYKSVADIAGQMKSAGQKYLVVVPRDAYLVRGLTNICPLDKSAMEKDFVLLGSFKYEIEVWRLRGF